LNLRQFLKKVLFLSALMSTLVLAFGLTLAPGTAFAAAQVKSCPPGWHFDDLINKGKNFKAVTGVYGQKDTLSHNITVNLTATTAGTVSFTSGDSSGVGLNFEFVQVHADVNSSVQYSYTTTVGHTVTDILKPGEVVYGQYGVERQIAEGHLYHVTSTCQIDSDHGYVTTDSPWYATWNLWS
jgi:hypothetical protein